MKPAHLLGTFGRTVVTEPDQPTPLNPAWSSLVARAIKCRSFEIRMSRAPLATGRMVLVDIASPIRVEGTRCRDLRVVRFSLQGDSRIRANGRILPDKPGVMIACEADTTFVTSGSVSLQLHIPARTLERAAGWHDASKPLPTVELTHDDGRELRDLAVAGGRELEQLHGEMRTAFARNLENLLAMRWAASILAQLPEIRSPDPMIGRRKFDDLLAWLHSDHDDPVTVGDLAAYCGLGLRALQKHFLRHTDTPPAEFLRNLRLDQARALIASGKSNVTQAALQAGFVHLGHFAGHYRRKFGENPSATAVCPESERKRTSPTG